MSQRSWLPLLEIELKAEGLRGLSTGFASRMLEPILHTVWIPQELPGRDPLNSVPRGTPRQCRCGPKTKPKLIQLLTLVLTEVPERPTDPFLNLCFHRRGPHGALTMDPFAPHQSAPSLDSFTLDGIITQAQPVPQGPDPCLPLGFIWILPLQPNQYTDTWVVPSSSLPGIYLSLPRCCWHLSS